MSWFEELTGFTETTGDEVRRLLSVDGAVMVSSVNGRSMRCGTLSTPSVGELRAARPTGSGRVTVREIVADVRALHADPANEGALFQVASQFNLLEMPSPSVTPEAGVTGYAHDRTQGPTCAIACGAGTIFRNWFAPVDGQVGQTAGRQIDCLSDLGGALDDGDGSLWEMTNGYALATADGLRTVADVLADSTPEQRDALCDLLRVGVHDDTEVTIAPGGHTVTQVYCSAVPVGYSPHGAGAWEPLARLVLDATYDATLSAAAANAERTGNPTVFLTLVGGGVFGNRIGWIVDAIARACRRATPSTDLDVAIVSYGNSKPELAPLIGEIA